MEHEETAGAGVAWLRSTGKQTFVRPYSAVVLGHKDVIRARDLASQSYVLDGGHLLTLY